MVFPIEYVYFLLKFIKNGFLTRRLCFQLLIFLFFSEGSRYIAFPSLSMTHPFKTVQAWKWHYKSLWLSRFSMTHLVSGKVSTVNHSLTSLHDLVKPFFARVHLWAMFISPSQQYLSVSYIMYRLTRRDGTAHVDTPWHQVPDLMTSKIA